MKNKIKLILLTSIMFISLITSVLAQNNNYYSCPMGAISGGYGTGVMLFSWTLSILFIILIVAGIYWLINSANKTSGEKNENKSKHKRNAL